MINLSIHLARFATVASRFRGQAHRLAFLAAIAVLSGCGGNGATEVHGTINSNGKPVTFGRINFQPAEGHPLGGAIEPDGTYRYELPPGEYKVRIDAPSPTAVYKEGDPPPTPGRQEPRQAPAQYASFETSGLSLTVGSESPQEHDFSLP